MKRFIHIYIIVAALATVAVSCTTKMEDMNHNPYALYDAKAEQFVQPVLFNTASNLMSVYRNLTAHLMQQAVSTNVEQTSKVVGNYNIPEATDDDVWVGLYTQYGNANYMAQKALTDKNPAMLGVANVLKAFIISQIADAYGNVPYYEAGNISLPGSPMVYITKYDTQKEIYQDLFVLLEEANDAFNNPDAQDFSTLCDFTYEGKIKKWQKFGNALYLRLLNRVVMKVEEEDGGKLELSDGTILNVRNKIAEIYNSYTTGGGNYPIMSSIEDCARVPFDENNASFHSPFYSTTSGNWGSGGRACETICKIMNETNESTKQGELQEYTYYTWAKGLHHDPRFDCFFHKTVGAPAQLRYENMNDFLECIVSSAGNSLVGRMPGTTVDSETGARTKTSGTITTTLYPEKGLKFSLQNPDFISLMNYSEVLFIFAEAGKRGYISLTYPEIRTMWLNAVCTSALEWRSDLSIADEEMVEFREWTYTKTSTPDDILENILTQKWISSFFVGLEAWNDYRRTGYPLIKTNGPAAENDNILPTRLRYPADEAYRNVKYYKEQIDGWLGGEDNMKTDVWWADTFESRVTRLQGRL